MATRLFWHLVHHGFPAERLLILDSGLSKWLATGGEVTKATTPTPRPGTISITTPNHGVRVKLPEFLRLHPAIKIELQLADRMVDVAYERIDIALRWSATPPQGLVSEPVAMVGWALVAAPAYLSNAGVPQSPADLDRDSCLCDWREASDDIWILACVGEMARVRVLSRYRVDNPEAVSEAAIAGLGIAMLPDHLCHDGLADGRLVRVLPGWTPQSKFGSLISAVSTAERMRLQRNQMLLSLLRQQLATA